MPQEEVMTEEVEDNTVPETPVNDLYDDAGEDEEVTDEVVNPVEGEENTVEENIDEEDSANEEETEAVEETEKVVTNQINPSLLVQLGRLGLADEEIDKVIKGGNDESVSSLIDVLSARQAKPESKASQTDGKTEWFNFDEKLEDTLDKDVTDALKGMNAKTQEAVGRMFEGMNAKIEALQGQISEGQAKREAEQFEKDTAQFDKALSGLGEDWESVFGKGAVNDIKPDSEQFNNRSKLFVEALSDKYSGDIAKRVENAAKVMFADHTEKLIKDKILAKARDRQGKFIGRSASKHTSDKIVDPTKNAIEALKKMGMQSTGEYDDYDDASTL